MLDKEIFLWILNKYWQQSQMDNTMDILIFSILYELEHVLVDKLIKLLDNTQSIGVLK